MCDTDISIDFCSLFDGAFRLRFTASSVVTFDYTSYLWSEWNYPYKDSPVVNYELVDSFVPSYIALLPHFLPDGKFYVDLPTCFGYHSSRGKWLTTGAHHTRLTFDSDVLFAH